jgi:hypothetical protein
MVRFLPGLEGLIMLVNRKLAAAEIVEQDAGPGTRAKDSSLAAYREFLNAKVVLSKDHGFAIEPGEVHRLLKPHQVDVVRWAVRGGRRAIFASFGLGKTMMQLECLRLVLHQRLCG